MLCNMSKTGRVHLFSGTTVILLNLGTIKKILLTGSRLFYRNLQIHVLSCHIMSCHANPCYAHGVSLVYMDVVFYMPVYGVHVCVSPPF